MTVKGRILVVEDEVIVRKDIVQMLSGLGYEVAGAVGTGGEAVRLAEKGRLDLVLMDIVLSGGMDGIEAAERIRERFGIPVVYLTAYADDAILGRARETEPLGYIVKPYDETDLRTTLEMAIYKAGIVRRLRESEERYKSLFEDALDMIHIIGCDRIIKDVNRAELDTLGYSREELVGHPASDIIHPDYRDTVIEQMQKVLSGEVVERYETVLRDSSGQDVLVEVTATPRIVNGKIIEARAIIRDITERKRVEQRLSEANSIINRSPSVAFTWCNTEGWPVEFVSDNVEQLFGYTAEEFISGSVSYASIVHPDDLDRVGGEVTGFSSDLTRQEFEHEPYRIVTRDGTVRWISDWTFIVRNQDGAIPYFKGIVMDITEKKLAEDGRQLLRRLLEVANRHSEMKPLLEEFVTKIKNFTRCEAVGIRILDEDSTAIPYHAFDGFSREFYELESPLKLDTDQCMCINVVKGETDPGLPFYTDGGSFYMNGTTKFLSTVSEEDKGQTRNACNAYGYESVALIPIRINENIIGLIHLADSREDRVPLDLVKLAETIGLQIGIAITRVKAETERRESESRYRDLVEILPCGVAEQDVNGVITWANPAHGRIDGCTADDLVGIPAYDMMPTSTERENLQNYFKLLSREQPEPQPVFSKNITRDGRLIDIRIDWDYLREEDGEHTGFISVVTDITAQRQAEENLSRESERAQEYLDLAGVIFVAIDTGGNVILINRKGREILGYTEEEIVGKNWFDHFIPARLREDLLPVFRALLKGEVEAVGYQENPVLTRSGDERLIAWTNTVIRNDNGGIIGHLSSGEDITARRQAEEQLLKARRLEFLGRLAGGVAHEVRNPLSAIMAICDAFAQELGDDPEYGQYLDHINEQVQRLSKLMNDLLNLGKPVEERNLITVPLKEVCSAAVDAWKQGTAYQQQRVRFESGLDGEKAGELHDSRGVPDFNVTCDSQRLQQVFVNLLENAAVHSTEGKEVVITMNETDDGYARVRITDQGNGIKPEYLSRVFEPFFTTRKGGSGLGLSIVKHIVESHGGSLELKNTEPGPGCTAEILLPLVNENN